MGSIPGGVIILVNKNARLQPGVSFSCPKVAQTVFDSSEKWLTFCLQRWGIARGRNRVIALAVGQGARPCSRHLPRPRRRPRSGIRSRYACRQRRRPKTCPPRCRPQPARVARWAPTETPGAGPAHRPPDGEPRATGARSAGSSPCWRARVAPAPP